MRTYELAQAGKPSAFIAERLTAAYARGGDHQIL